MNDQSFVLTNERVSPFNACAPANSNPPVGGACGTYVEHWWGEVQPKIKHLPPHQQIQMCREYLEARAKEDSGKPRNRLTEDIECPPECLDPSRKQDPKRQGERNLVGTALENIVRYYLVQAVGERSRNAHIRRQDNPSPLRPATIYDATFRINEAARKGCGLKEMWMEIKASVTGDRKQQAKWQCFVAEESGAEFVILYGLDYKGDEHNFADFFADGLNPTIVCIDTARFDEFLAEIAGVAERANRWLN